MSRKPKKTVKISASRPLGDTVSDTTMVGQNSEEEKMIDFLDELSLFRELRPKLRKALKSNNAKEIMTETEAYAALRLVDLMNNSTSDAVRFQAAKELLYMRGHKPVDKSAVLGMNVDSMTEGELTAQIKALLGDGSEQESTSNLTETQDEDERD